MLDQSTAKCNSGTTEAVTIMGKKLHNVFPLEELRCRYPRPVTVEQLGLENINDVIEREHDRMLSLALHIWNRMLMDGQFSHLHPQFIAPYIDGPPLELFGWLNAMCGQQLLDDFSYKLCTNDDGFVVGRLILADTFLAELHIADVRFQNPELPLSKDERKHEDQSHRGFGLILEVFKNAERFAAEEDCKFVVLVAETISRVKTFKRYGYRLVSDSVGRAQKAMFKPVKKKDAPKE
jgi:hypothetical protein